MTRHWWKNLIQRSMSGARGPKRSRPRFRPLLEHLESRLVPTVTTINVNDGADVLDNPVNVTAATLGPNVTLRDAINAANNTAGIGN